MMLLPYSDILSSRRRVERVQHNLNRLRSLCQEHLEHVHIGNSMSDLRARGLKSHKEDPRCWTVAIGTLPVKSPAELPLYNDCSVMASPPQIPARPGMKNNARQFWHRVTEG